MRKNWKALLSMSLLLLFSACAATPENPGAESQTESAYHKITAEEARKMMEDGNRTIVDVRTAEEYSGAHVPGAVNLPNEAIGKEQPDALPDLEAVIIVYCRTGVRSKQASDKLVGLGYQNIYDMGGIVDWPYETESGGGKGEQ